VDVAASRDAQVALTRIPAHMDIARTRTAATEALAGIEMDIA
jgi:hypothetical protein